MATAESSGDQHRALQAYAGYKVHDNQGEKIGKVDDLFVDENNRPEYIGVKTGLFGMRKSLVPMETAQVNDRAGIIEVSESKDRIKDAPNFGGDDEITSELEARVLGHFGLRSPASGSESRSSYGEYYSSSDTGEESSSGNRPRAGYKEEEESREDSGTSRDEEGERSEEYASEHNRAENGSDTEDESEEARESGEYLSESSSESSSEDLSEGSGWERYKERTSSSGEHSGEEESSGGGLDAEEQSEGMRIRKRSQTSGGAGRESVRVPVKREKARARRVRSEDGEEELRISKEVVEEEETVEVEESEEGAGTTEQER